MPAIQQGRSWIPCPTNLRKVARPSLPLILLALSLSCADAPVDSRRSRIDAIASELLVREGAPGLSVAVLDGSDLAYAAAFGFADMEAGRPMRVEDVHQIGSISKQITAAAIAQLAHAGKLSLDDPIERRLPNVPDHWRGIPIRSLLNMTSGIPEFVTDPEYAAQELDFASPEEFDRAALFAFIAQRPLAFPPEEHWSYSNTNYMLLGMIVEAATGRSLYDHVDSALLASPQLEKLRPFAFGPAGPGEAVGYMPGESGPTRSLPLNPQTTMGDGGFSSDAPTLARWGRMLARGEAIEAEAWRDMLRPARLNDGTEWPYGAGLQLRPLLGSLERVWHTGVMPGFSAALAHYPSRDVTVAVLINRGNVWAESFEAAIARAYMDLDLPQFVEEDLPIGEANRFIGLYDLFSVWAQIRLDPDRGLELIVTGPTLDAPALLDEPLFFAGDGLLAGRKDPEWIRVQLSPGYVSSERVAIDAFGQRWQGVRRTPTTPNSVQSGSRD